MEREEERGHAVGQAHRENAEWPARFESEPHQRDVLERVTERARRDRALGEAEISPA